MSGASAAGVAERGWMALRLGVSGFCPMGEWHEGLVEPFLFCYYARREQYVFESLCPPMH